MKHVTSPRYLLQNWLLSDTVSTHSISQMYYRSVLILSYYSCWV